MTPPPSVTFDRRRPDELTSVVDALADLYALVYAEPPYLEGTAQVARFRTGLPDEAARPGFRLVLAWEGEELIGAAYGWTMAAGTWWSRAKDEPPAEVRDRDKFAVLEWIVHPRHRYSWRRRGVDASASSGAPGELGDPRLRSAKPGERHLSPQRLDSCRALRAAMGSVDGTAGPRSADRGGGAGWNAPAGSAAMTAAFWLSRAPFIRSS